MVVARSDCRRVCPTHLRALLARRYSRASLLWNDPVSGASNEFSAALAAMILKDLLSGQPRYRQMVATFQGLAGLENDLTVLTNLKAETEQALAAELREAEERAAQLRRQAEELRSSQHHESPAGRLPDASQARPDPADGMKKPSPPLQGPNRAPYLERPDHRGPHFGKSCKLTVRSWAAAEAFRAAWSNHSQRVAFLRASPGPAKP